MLTTFLVVKYVCLNVEPSKSVYSFCTKYIIQLIIISTVEKSIHTRRLEVVIYL